MSVGSEYVIVAVHNGCPRYLKSCLRRAVAANSGGRVVLLGDAANASLGIGEHHRHDDESLRSDIDDFRAIYRHLSSSQTIRFERFCIERWFLVRNFLRREKLTRCLVVDSDVLLFCDAQEEAARYRDRAMTFGRWDGVRYIPHCNFIGSSSALEDFCAFVLNVYRDPTELERLRRINLKKFDQDWISDMSLFHAWATRGTYPVALIDTPTTAGPTEASVFDAAIDDTREFRKSGYLPGILRQWKKIEFRDGLPYAFRATDGRAVRMKCLHYHGSFKILMERHARGVSENLWVTLTMLRMKIARWPWKIWLILRNYLVPALRNRSEKPGRA